MSASYVYALVFNTDLGKTYTVRLTDADPSAEAEDVKSAMQAVIDADVIAHKNGAPSGILKASLIITETDEINVN